MSSSVSNVAKSLNLFRRRKEKRSDGFLFRTLLKCKTFSSTIILREMCLKMSWNSHCINIHARPVTEVVSLVKMTENLPNIFSPLSISNGGWSGGAKVLCILHHRGVQLILAYSWARPAILVVGKGRGGMFLFLLFLHFHSCSSFFPVPLFHLLYSLFYLFSPFLWETTQNDPQGLTCR